MPYPLISEYIEAIMSAEDNFRELSYLRPVLDDDGLPVMTSGNFAVVFKMKDERDGKLYALKCFTRDQEGRAEAYQEIVKYLKDVSSSYLVSIRYLEKELFVDTDQTTETEFPVLLMDWVEGKTLDKYLRDNYHYMDFLETFAWRFSQLVEWLILQPFAHGDLKPDNILVREDDYGSVGSFVLVDYDGMYVPTMKGQKARELGSPDFHHPQRTQNDFDEHIDDFPLLLMMLSLKAISFQPSLMRDVVVPGRLLFSEEDLANLSSCRVLKELFPSTDIELNRLYGLFLLFHSNRSLQLDINLFMSESVKRYYLDEFDLTETWMDEFGAIYSKDKTKLIVGVDLEEYSILEGTTIVCKCAFDGCRKLSKIKFPPSVVTIDHSAFDNCINLQSVEIPDGVTLIDAYTFSGCVSLKNVLLPNSIEEIGLHAFSGCSSLYSVNLPKNLKGIEYAAFSDCPNLTEIFLNSEITDFFVDAFYWCSPNLKIFVRREQMGYYEEMFSRLSRYVNNLYWIHPFMASDESVRYMGDIYGNLFLYPSKKLVTSYDEYIVSKSFEDDSDTY